MRNDIEHATTRTDPLPDPVLITIQKDFYMHYRENENYYALRTEHHNDYEVILVLEGKIEITVNAKTYVAEANDIVIMNNLEFHRISVLQYPYRRSVLAFKKSFLSQIAGEPVLTSVYNYRPRGFNHVFSLAEESAEEVRGLFDQMLREYTERGAYWENSVKMLLGQLTICLYRTSAAGFPLSSACSSINKKIIVDIQNYVDDHYMEDMTLKDISGQFHVNMYYLCHLFKEITDSTFKNYLLGRRISFAKDMLSHTNKDVSVIAGEVGFNSSNNFIRTFRRFVNLTPHQYRKSFQKDGKSMQGKTPERPLDSPGHR